MLGNLRKGGTLGAEVRGRRGAVGITIPTVDDLGEQWGPQGVPMGS